MTTLAASAHERGVAVLEDLSVNRALPSRRSSSAPAKHPATATFAHNPGLAMKRSASVRIACADEDPEVFFGPVDSSENGKLLSWEKKALAICAKCLIQRECLAEALRHPSAQQHGVVGGMTASHRRALLRHRCQHSRQAA